VGNMNFEKLNEVVDEVLCSLLDYEHDEYFLDPDYVPIGKL